MGPSVHDFKSRMEEGDWGKSSVFLGGDSNSHNRDRVHMNRCLFVNSCETELSESTITKPLLVAIQKAIPLLILVSIQCLNNQSAALHNKRSTNPPSTSVHLATGVRKSRVVRLSWTSRYFMQAEAAKMLASSSSRISLLLFETLLHIQPHKQNLTVLFLDLQTALYLSLTL